MKKEEELYEGRCTRWRLNTEYRTDLWSKELLRDKINVSNKSEVDRGAFDRIGSDTQPRTECGCMGGGLMMRMLGRMSRQLRVGARSTGRAMLPIPQRPVVESHSS